MVNIKKSSILSVTKCTILSAAVLLGALVPSYADNNHATPIGNGQATGGESIATAGQATSVTLQFNLVLLPDGQLNGKASLASADGSVKVKLKSYTFREGALLAEGLITSLTGTPRFGPAFLFPDGNQVGDTIFFQVFDRDNDQQPDAFVEGALPAWFWQFVAPNPPFSQSGTDINAIINILAVVFDDTGVSPAQNCRQVINGNFQVHGD